MPQNPSQQTPSTNTTPIRREQSPFDRGNKPFSVQQDNHYTQPAQPSNDSMIENKVFKLLNSYFAGGANNQPQPTHQQQPEQPSEKAITNQVFASLM